MNRSALLGMALDLQLPWQVTDISFFSDELTRNEHRQSIGIVRGSRFSAACPVHDTGNVSDGI